MFPISDDNPSSTTPFVSWTILGLCVLAYLWQMSLGQRGGEEAIYELGMIPARVFGDARLPAGLDPAPPYATIVTSMFMHGGLMHLGGNMLFLWIFGDNVEDAMGHARFLVFYVLCGAAAALGQGLLDPTSTIPMIGASGAISGVLGAYLLLYPRATVKTLIFIGFFVTLVYVPAMVVLGIWFLGQLVSAAMTPVGQPGIAFAAHIGGFLAGLVLIPLFKRREVPLLQAQHHRFFETEARRGPWG